MIDQDKPVIPEDHPIREIWEINKRRREDNIGFLIELARNGDKDAAKVLIAKYAHLLHRERDDQERGVKNITPGYIDYKNKLENYILDAISDTLKTRDANYGFNLIHATKSRPKLTYKEKESQSHLAYEVAKIVDGAPSENRAFEIAEVELGISKSQAKAVYKKYMKLVKK